MKKNLVLLLAMMLCLLFCLSGCGKTASQEPPPAEPEEAELSVPDPKLSVTELQFVVSGADELNALEEYPNLVQLDLRGSTCYAEIADYIATHPDIKVVYDVAIGDTIYPMDTASLTLTNGTFTSAELMEKLVYLPMVTELSLPQTTLSREELLTLDAQYPEIITSYTVMLLGEEIPGDIETLDLSNLMSGQVEDAVQALSRLTALTEVQLMPKEETSTLTPADVKLLMDAAPEAEIFYSFQLFGKTITTSDERVEFTRVNIGDQGVEQVRQALEILPHCNYFLMDCCDVSDEVLASLRDEYPEKNIVWRIFYAGGQSCLTDVTVFRTIGDLYDSNVKQLKYLKDVVYMDIGHCYHLTDISFIGYMPKLKVLIMSDCHTPNLEPLRVCKELEWLEIVNCNQVTDLSPLADCVSLRGVNMSFLFGADDLSPLYGLENLERLFMGRNDLPQETIDEARAALPNCWVTDKSESVQWISFNYSIGWRLDDEHTLADWYLEICPIFGYTRKIY